MKHKTIAIIILLLMVMSQIGTDIYLASLPAMHIALISSTNTVQYTFSIFLMGFALSQLFYGPLSDRYGRRPFILIGLILYSVMGLLCCLSINITGLLLARFIQGIGAGACTVIARAMMQDTFKGEDLAKINIYQSMVWSIVPISAPLLGSYIQQYLGWRYNFLLLTALSVLVLIICWLKLPETIKHREESIKIKQILIDYKNILFTKSFLPYLLFSACIISLFAVFNISAPLVIQILFKQSAVVYGWSVFCVAIIFTLGSFISRLLVYKLSAKKLMLIGLIIIILAGFSLIISSSIIKPNLYRFLAAMMFIQIGAAIAFPSAAAETIRPFSQKAGKASAVFGCTLFLSSAISSAFISHSHEVTLMPFVTMISSLIAIMTLTYLFFIYKATQTEERNYD